MNQTAEPDLSGVHVWLVLWKASRALEAHARRHVAGLSLGMSEFAILEALLHRGPMAVGALGERVLLTSGSITTAVDRLEAQALVERRPSATDRRARLVRLTPAGRRLITRAFQSHATAMEAAAAGLAPAERATLLRLLRKLGKTAAAL